MSFTRMDQSTVEDWMVIGGEVAKRQSQMPAMIKSMLKQLEDQVDGFSMNQLQHALQTATMAERAGASEELIVAALCHDIGKVISVINHPAIAAEILKPYVSPETYEVIRTHQDFQGKHYYEHFGMNPNLREEHESQPWFELAKKFTDEWDQAAFDPNYETQTLEHFEPMIDRVFSKELVRVQK
ncbi:MAG: HD domain-containing protein [Acidobacteria bacterium]|nr:HD domain-containing protein [Acidobacteriota bacterium]